MFRERTQAEWVALAARIDIPLGPAHQGVAELRDDPHLAARQIVVDGEVPDVGPFAYVGTPVIVDGEPFTVRRPAPRLGEHTDEVLTALGYTDAEIAALRARGVVS